MNFLSQLKEHANNYDLGSMDALVKDLSPFQLEENKQEIIDIYDMLYGYCLYELDCNKVSDPEDFTFYLLEIIESIQRFFPDQMYYQERGYCYENLADVAA